MILTISLFLSACSSIPKGTLLGAGIGLGAGDIIATQERRNSQKNAALAVSAIIGGAVGYYLSKEKIKEEQEARANIHQSDFSPRLNRPEVKRIWVPDQISGDEYISGHWKFIIDKNAVWSKEN